MGDTLAGTAQAEDPVGKVFFFINENFRLCPKKGSPFADIAGNKPNYVAISIKPE